MAAELVPTQGAAGSEGKRALEGHSAAEPSGAHGYPRRGGTTCCN
jgi:hypothetical protein